MKVIAVDGGHPVASGSPAMGSIGVLYPGERMDVLVDRGGRTTRQSAELVVTLDGEYVAANLPQLFRLHLMLVPHTGI